MDTIMDIRDMPGYNPAVLNGVDSVSRGQVKLTLPFIANTHIGFRLYPTCHRHGAMLRVSKDGIYRCGEFGCDNGCYYP